MAEVTAAKAGAVRAEAALAKVVGALAVENLGEDTLTVTLKVEDGKVTGEVRRKAAGNGPATHWTDARKQELADHLRGGLSKAKAAAEMGVSESSVSNIIFTSARNVAGFLAKHPPR